MEEPILVSRWGRPGLREGDWVMRGGTTRMNYLLSGKWDPFPWNEYAAYSSGQTFEVSLDLLHWPRGLDWWKGILGQRFYAGPDIILPKSAG